MCKESTSLISFLVIVAAATQAGAQLPAGWSSQDIGGPAVAGGAEYDGATQTWTIRGGGEGVRGRTDQFHYVYRRLSGNGELVARVVSIEPAVDEWAMAGVMIRVLLDPASPYVFMAVTPNGPNLDHGVTYYGREAPGGAADHESSGAMTVPYWVKISRVGNTFAGFHSPDGQNWTEQWSADADLVPPDTYIGFAVTSDLGGSAVTAVFDNGPVRAHSPQPADGSVDVSTPLLQWTPGVSAVAHDVYTGTDPALGPDQYAGRLPGGQKAFFISGGTVAGVTHYWRIDEIDDQGNVRTGDVWSFTMAPATAYRPEPWNGAKGVDVDADLSWKAGIGSASHDVYFGTDRAAVETADPATFNGNQVSMVYELGTLAEDTTYYWRIDEHAGDGAVHEGAVWSFATVGPGIGVKARYFEGTDAEGVPVLTQIEDSIDRQWGNGEVAAGMSDAVSARWTADLEVPYTETYQLITTSDDGVRLWLDGRLLINNWTTHGATDDTADVRLVAGQVYRLRMQWFDNTGGAVAQLFWQSRSIPRQIIPAGPLQLPVRAAGARPANGAVDVAQMPTLRWNAGEEAAGHDVYFGQDAQAVADATPADTGVYRGRQALDASSFTPGVLEWNQTYYWRVDEVNDANPDSAWKGAVWSFTTADFVVIDDFESYTNDVGERAFEVWIDGMGFSQPEPGHPGNGTGAAVGHDIWSSDSPYYNGLIMETGIVHGGAQSLPVSYDNTAAPLYSEIERSWAAPQDWTVNGADTLVLYVRGTAGSALAPLYVVVEDSLSRVAVITHGDEGLVATTRWTEWRIPLSDLSAAGVDIQGITEMAVGVGDRNNPQSSGTGTFFIDDIRVIQSAPTEAAGAASAP